ncbi:prenyltransferase/squalene oxidase repeat-containing protein [Nonomuraea sp. NPDC023979]|uniref:prenyltransferase/squalene oxidase repeat-containing protein n=1 Tax=Nonomuraea sp. NPDC023979 TaxID=3154796 RepID=UPI0033D2A7D5
MNVAREAAALVSTLMALPWGQVSASIYETGRLVTLAPWLTGHRERVAYLLERQLPDGSWGAPDGYGLVPTLSATEALLSAGGASWAERDAELREAAERGLRVLRPWLAGPVELPDMPAVELIVPSLVALINAHAVGAPLPLPDGMDFARVERLRHVVRSGAALPEKLLHALEVAGPAAGNAHAVRPTPIGTIGASPAATAAWLGAVHPDPRPGTRPGEPADALAGRGPAGRTALLDAPARPVPAGPATVAGPLLLAGPADLHVPEGSGGAASRGSSSFDGSLAPGADGGQGEVVRAHLEAVVSRYGGPVPVGFPITVFERGWVLSWLVRAGVPVTAPPEMVADLRAAIGPAGTPAGPGLPADADTTSVALYALALVGQPHDPASLLEFDVGTHFCTWQGEDGFSVSVNAHVLDAFGAYAARRPDRARAYEPVVRRLSALLADRQQPDGSWDDRWHASPFYATLSCVLALGEYGGPGRAEAIRRARAWVLSAQRPDGSWGRWEGTLEETAYALQTLLACDGELDEQYESAVDRGYRYLRTVADISEHPPLWHDKDLYTPFAIVRSAILAALHLCETKAKTGQIRT